MSTACYKTFCKIILFLTFASSIVTSVELTIKNAKCTPRRITGNSCKNNGFYNHTSEINLANQDSQDDAENSIRTYSPLIQYGCSAKLSFLLCAVYNPMCDVTNKFLVGPCRSLCEDVKKRCFDVLASFNIAWPEVLNCNAFPVNNTHENMCMEGPQIKESPLGNGFGNTHPKNPNKPGMNSPILRAKCGHLKNWRKYVFVNKTGMCALKCEANDLFDNNDKFVAQIWMGVFSGVCFFSTLFTFLTFLMNPQRFKYPERPVVFLAMCYNIYSISYFIRLFAGRSTIVCDRDITSGEQILIQNGLENKPCAIIFLLHYYFGTASSLWWVMLTVTWFLAAGLKWGDEAIVRRAGYLHFTAWSIPFVLTLIALIMNVVDADELLGMCSVGQQRANILMAFMIIPRLIFLVLGTFFLLGGFIALSQIRRHVKNDGLRTDKLEVLMVRIGLFSILYIIPAASVTGCEIYEFVQRNSWYSRVPIGSKDARPNVEIFMLKSFMSLVVGITSGVWIWSRKTFTSWSNFCRLTKPRDHAPLVQHPLSSPGVFYPVQKGMQHGGQRVVSGPMGSQVHHTVCMPLPPTSLSRSCNFPPTDMKPFKGNNNLSEAVI